MRLRKILTFFPMTAAGLVHRASGRVAVGAGSDVNWLRLSAGGGGQIEIGTASSLHCRVDFDTPGKGCVRVGDRCFIGASHLVCHTSITIGDDVIVSWGLRSWTTTRTRWTKSSAGSTWTTGGAAGRRLGRSCSCTRRNLRRCMDLGSEELRYLRVCVWVKERSLGLARL